MKIMQTQRKMILSDHRKEHQVEKTLHNKRNPTTFKFLITENGTNYVEEVQIDEENELEYSYVPAHNEVVKAAYVYHFKNATLKAVLHFPCLVPLFLCKMLLQ